jgi:hypothetical protein
MNEAVRADILDKAARGVLLQAIFDEFDVHVSDDNDPVISALAGLHNERLIDVLAIVTPETLEPYRGYIFFRGQFVYNKLISRLDASAESLVNLVEALIQAAGNDGAALLPIDEFAKWCAAKPDRPAELLSLVDRKVPNADRFLIVAIKKGVEVDRDYFMDRAYGFLLNGSESETRAAAIALGQIPLEGADDWGRLLDAFTSLLDQDPSDLVRASMLDAIVRRLQNVPSDSQTRLVDLGKSAASQLGEQVLNSTARALAFNLSNLTDDLIETLLEGLRHVDSSQAGTIDVLDFALAKLVERGRASDVCSFVAELLRRDIDPVGLERFDSLRSHLFQNSEHALEDWLVAWLLDGDFALCGPLNDTLFEVETERHVLQIDFARFHLRADDYPYIARKAIGTFFLKPELMASILTSLLRTAPKKEAQEIAALLADPVLVNYSGVASEILEPIASDSVDPAATYVRGALEAKTQYLQDLGSIGVVRELHPSERERLMEWQRHSDSMTAAFRESRKKSVLASIATELVMLYGTGSISWVEDRSSPPRRLETPLATFSHSFEIPRTEIVDPIGLQQMIIHFRRENRPA